MLRFSCVLSEFWLKNGSSPCGDRISCERAAYWCAYKFRVAFDASYIDLGNHSTRKTNDIIS